MILFLDKFGPLFNQKIRKISSRKEENKEAGDLFVVQFQAMATQLENYNG
jgi:hypothetical protein